MKSLNIFILLFVVSSSVFYFSCREEAEIKHIPKQIQYTLDASDNDTLFSIRYNQNKISDFSNDRFDEYAIEYQGDHVKNIRQILSSDDNRIPSTYEFFYSSRLDSIKYIHGTKGNPPYEHVYIYEYIGDDIDKIVKSSKNSPWFVVHDYSFSMGNIENIITHQGPSLDDLRPLSEHYFAYDKERNAYRSLDQLSILFLQYRTINPLNQNNIESAKVYSFQDGQKVLLNEYFLDFEYDGSNYPVMEKLGFVEMGSPEITRKIIYRD